MSVESLNFPEDTPRISFKNILNLIALPEKFDSQDKWPKCIHPIMAQLNCGSCWAFSGSEVLSDRFCIASKGAIDVVLSQQHMVSCDKGNKGCHGGNMPPLWKFLENNGIVSNECLPYESGADGTDFECTKYTKCAAGNSYLHYAKKGQSRSFEDIESIKLEIMTNGPVQAGFMVYADFKEYKSGVYVQNSSKLLGGHAVKVVGWGVENGVEYWRVANSWGPAWGEAGFFRIKMGQCQLEEHTYAGQADVARANKDKAFKSAFLNF